VGEVRVHLEHQVGAVLERHREAGEVGAPEALLAGPVKHPDIGELLDQAVGYPARPVG
jgi:hypothetical protein